MQTDESELLFTPSILETPSLLTPDIVATVSTIQSIYDPLHTTYENLSSSQSSSISTNGTASTVSSADVKVSKIEDQLKQSLMDARKPTPSPFQAMSNGRSVFNLDKPISVEDGGMIQIPSTADVVKELEAMTNTSTYQVKTVLHENHERDAVAVGTVTFNGDPMRYDSPPPIKGTLVSPPKKMFLNRSQSHTEPSSPMSNNTNFSQSQKTNLDNGINGSQNGIEADGEPMDDSINNPFTRTVDLIPMTHSHDHPEQQFKPTIDMGNDHQHLSSLLRIDQNGHGHPIIKQQPVVVNNLKRSLVNNAPSMTKSSTMIIPHSSSLNEVTSTDQSSSVKRQRTAGSISSNPTVMNIRPTFPSAGSATATNSLANTSPNGNMSDDQRKKQIRDSNREAARRCRERRRNYIEQLEGNLEHHKGQIKQLTDKLARIERENTQLRAILSETKILHPSSRISLNETHVDFANVISASSMDLPSESTDGGTITRSYLNRTNL